MKLFTITATPYQVRNKHEKNKSLVACYPSNVARVLRSFGVDGFTIYQVYGYWQGKSEPSFKIELALDDDSNDGGESAEATAYMIAEELRAKYGQDAVMLTLPDNSVKFIEEE